MKKSVLCVLTIIMIFTLGTFSNVNFVMASESVSITADTQWKYLDTGVDPAGTEGSAGYNRTSWTALNFDDSAWKTGSGVFGAKNGSASVTSTYTADVVLDGCTGSKNHPAYFFRTKVDIPVNSATTIKKITGTISYDDALIIYINGVQAIAFNETGCTSNSSFSSTYSSGYEKSFEITDTDILNSITNGQNIIAVELHNSSSSSSDVLFKMTNMTFLTEINEITTQLIAADDDWQYLDNGTDPAGTEGSAGYNRTSWTAPDFDDTSWKTGANPFGARRKSGQITDNMGEEGTTTHIASTVLDGMKSTPINPTYYYRKTFTIDSLDGMTQLNGEIQNAGTSFIYINGHRVAAYCDRLTDSDTAEYQNTVITKNSQYGGYDSGLPRTTYFTVLDMSILNEGENVIAVEVHTMKKTYHYTWFSLLNLEITNEPLKYGDYKGINMVMGKDETEMNFTWHSVFDTPGTIKVAKTSELVEGNMPQNAKEITAKIETYTNNVGYYGNMATVTGLEADTRYSYQISNGDTKSSIYTFKTDGNGSFSFALAGDPQINGYATLSDHSVLWGNSLKKMVSSDKFSDIAFMACTGDYVEHAWWEKEFDGYLEHDEIRSLPMAVAIGNHDSYANIFQEHFNVPNKSEKYGDTHAGKNYYFTYNNTLFMVLNTNNTNTAEHKAFMLEAIEATKNLDIEWRVVLQHHSMYALAEHATKSDVLKKRAELSPLYKSLGIDVVLQGHDHVYCRTYMMDGTEIVTADDGYEYANGTDNAPTAVNNSEDTLYITAQTSSGSKKYNIKDMEFPYAAVKSPDVKVPHMSKIDVTENSFTITVYNVNNMSVVDSFTIKRNPTKVNIDVKIPQASLGGNIVAALYDSNNVLKGAKIYPASELHNIKFDKDGAYVKVMHWNMESLAPLSLIQNINVN